MLWSRPFLVSSALRRVRSPATTVFRRITQDVVNRRAVPSGRCRGTDSVPRHHRDVGIAARADRNAVEIADSFRVLGDQTPRRQRRPPDAPQPCAQAEFRIGSSSGDCGASTPYKQPRNMGQRCR